MIYANNSDKSISRDWNVRVRWKSFPKIIKTGKFHRFSIMNYKELAHHNQLGGNKFYATLQRTWMIEHIYCAREMKFHSINFMLAERKKSLSVFATRCPNDSKVIGFLSGFYCNIPLKIFGTSSISSVRVCGAVSLKWAFERPQTVYIYLHGLPATFCNWINTSCSVDRKY